MSWLEKYYPSLLLTILAFAFFSRIIMIHKPSGYMFDEVYHAVTAKLIARDDLRAYEWWNPAPEPDTAVDWLHPPLAKYTQAAMIYFLGEYPFAWRLSSAIFGVGVIWLTALLTEELFQNKRLSLLAALIASLDGLLLTMSRIAMNDIHVTFFILLTFLMYVKHLRYQARSKKYIYSKYLLFTGICAGLAISTKWSGIFALSAAGISQLFIFVSSIYKKQQIRKFAVKSTLIPLLKTTASLLIIPAIIYVLSYSHMFLQGKDLKHFLELHRQTWHYQTHLDATHPYESRPLEWMLNLRPVWFAVDYVSDTHKANIYAFGNPAVFWIGVISIVASFALLFTKKVGKNKKFLIFLLLAYFIVWLPWQLSPRIMFFYHYTPAVPLLAIISAFVLYKAAEIYKRWGPLLLVASLLTMAAAYIIWFPHWTYIPMPNTFINKVYFALDQWK